MRHVHYSGRVAQPDVLGIRAVEASFPGQQIRLVAIRAQVRACAIQPVRIEDVEAKRRPVRIEANAATVLHAEDDGVVRQVGRQVAPHVRVLLFSPPDVEHVKIVGACRAVANHDDGEDDGG